MTGTNLDPSVTAASFIGNLTGNVSGAVSPTTFFGTGATVAAFGATQGTATLIGNVMFVVATATASTEGVRLPTAATNRVVVVMSPSTIGVKVYPFAGDKIGTASTNSAVALVAGRSNLYYAQDATTWLVLKGG